MRGCVLKPRVRAAPTLSNLLMCRQFHAGSVVLAPSPFKSVRHIFVQKSVAAVSLGRNAAHDAASLKAAAASLYLLKATSVLKLDDRD